MNQYGTQILSPDFRTRFATKSDIRLKVNFLDNVVTLNSKKIFGTGPNHGGGTSVPLQHKVDIITLIPIKNSGCKTALNSSQVITMSERPCPVLLKTSGMC